MADHADARDEGLPLRLSPLRSLAGHHVLVKGLFLPGEHLSMLLLLVQLLLLGGGFELILVFECLSFHGLLAGEAFLVGLSAVLAHLLLLLQLHLVAL